MNLPDVRQLVAAVCDGNDDAYHTLLEIGNATIPILIELFSSERSGNCRARIVELIWQYRLTSCIPFLASALRDPHTEVWKQALDGLVAIGGADSRKALIDFRSVISPNDERRVWIDEAIDQIKS